MTLSNTDQPFEHLVQTIAPGSTLVRTWPLQGGISAAMTAIEIRAPDGQTRRMIVRRPSPTTLSRNPRAAQDEYQLLQLTQSLGLATPTPYYLDQSGAIFPSPYIVIDYIEGQPEFAPADSVDFAQQVATQLAKIHTVEGTLRDVAFLPKRAYASVDTFGEPPTHLNLSMDEGRIRDTLEPIWPAPQRNASVLLHGDVWPGNLLWRDGQLVAVIDWEDAHLGDPLTDLAITRLDLCWIFGTDAMQTFTQQYQALMAIDYTNLPYWDLYAALRLVRLAGANLAEWVAFYEPFGRSDITEQTLLAQYRYFVDQAFEKLAA